MKWNPFGTHIHSQIVWPLMLASVVVGVVASLVAVGIIGGVIDQWIESSAHNSAEVTVARVEAVHENASRNLRLILGSGAFSAAIEAGDPDAIERGLITASQELGADALVMLDGSGTVVASAGPMASPRGTQGLDARGSGWSSGIESHPGITAVDDGYALAVVEPVLVAGREGWSLATWWLLDDAFLKEINAGMDSSVLLIDPGGRVEAAAYATQMRGGALEAVVVSPTDPFLNAMAPLSDDPTGSSRLRLDGGEYRIARRELTLTSHKNGPELWLATIVDARVAADARSATTRLIALWSLLGVLVLLGLNWWVARSVTEPLSALSRSAARVAEGDFSAKVDMVGANEVTELAQNFNRMTDSLRDRSESLTKKVLELATLYEMSRSLGSTLELETLLESVLESALRIFDVEIGYVTMVDRDTGALQLRAWKGTDLSRADEGTVRNSMSEWVIREGRPLIFNPQTDMGSRGRSDEVSGALAALCVPLPSAEGTIGAITVGSRDATQRFTSDDVRLLATIANHVTIAVGNIDLFSSVQEAYLATVRALAAAVDAKDPYTRGHSDGVATYALRIGEAMGFTQEQMVALEMAAYLHDIGKIGISEDILLKPGKLTDAEMSQMRHHPLIGANILKPVAFPWPIAPIVRHHHEHFDGEGYPAGLKTEEIPVLARVLTVADSFEAMVADRPYRRGRSKQEAMLELRRCSGTQFDPRIVEAFIDVLETSEAEYIELSDSDDEIGADEAQAVYIAICDGMFSGFRRLGGPRLANNLEHAMSERLRTSGVPLAFEAGRLVGAAGEVGDEALADHLARALALMAESIEDASGAGLADHFLAEALGALPERMRTHAERLGFTASS